MSDCKHEWAYNLLFRGFTCIHCGAYIGDDDLPDIALRDDEITMCYEKKQNMKSIEQMDWADWEEIWGGPNIKDTKKEVDKEKGCQHEFVEYQGLFEQYEYCKKCDERKDK